MNKNFKKHVKDTEKRMLLKTIFLILIFIGIVLLYVFSGIDYGAISFFLSCFFYVFFSITTKKERNDKKKYGVDVDRNVYLYLKDDVNKLKSVCDVLEVDFDSFKYNGSLLDFVQMLIDRNQVIFLKKNFDLNEAINTINKLLMYRRCSILLNIYEVLERDNELIKEKRKTKVNNDLNDLATIGNILGKSGIRLVTIYSENDVFSKFARIDGYLLTVVFIDNEDKEKDD